MPRFVWIRAFRSLEVEEQILAGAAFLSAIAVLFPWFGGDWYGQEAVWMGLEFYTSFIGLLVLLAHIAVVTLTILPLIGHALLTAERRDQVRFVIGCECVLLLIVALSVFTKISLESPRLETRFGVYVSLIGSIVVSLYAFLRMKQRHDRTVQEFFHVDTPDPSAVTSVEAPAEPPVVRTPRARPLSVHRALSPPPPMPSTASTPDTPILPHVREISISAPTAPEPVEHPSLFPSNRDE